jgi:hypothetical protein
MVLAAVKILVNTALGKAVEAADCLLQSTSIDVQHDRELRERIGVHHRPRDGGADRNWRTSTSRGVARRKSNRPEGWDIPGAPDRTAGVAVTIPLKECLVGKALSVPVNQKGMRAAQLDELRAVKNDR